jgi:hypothetical protein
MVFVPDSWKKLGVAQNHLIDTKDEAPEEMRAKIQGALQNRRFQPDSRKNHYGTRTWRSQ